MWKSRMVGLAILVISLLAVSRLCAQAWPASALYQIVSGQYIECCGIAGSFRYSLPDKKQAFIQLTVQSNLATMSFLGDDMKTIFSIMACPPADPINYTLSYGFVSSNYIFFHVDPGPPPDFLYWSYSVSNLANGLRIDGTLGGSPNGCADLPNQFSHSNVVALLMPTVSIRVSEVELCWNTFSNRNYQPQYRSTLTTNQWSNLGPVRSGDGSTDCLPDPVPVGEPQRFYRVVIVP